VHAVRASAYHLVMSSRALPLATVEFLAVDVETNGRPGDDCELTEVGAVLVGGGELHDRFESLVRVSAPLSRGIQRFTGISQAMVDAGQAPAEVLLELARRLEGRALVAHSAAFDSRVLRQAFSRAGLAWPDPPVLCTVAIARRFAPLAGQLRLRPLAESLGIEVQAVHRALPDAETCARVFCALFPRLCAHAGTLGEAVDLLAPRRRARRAPRAPAGTGAARGRPRRSRGPAPLSEIADLPDEPGVYVFRDERGRALYVGKSVRVRTRARTHLSSGAGWVEQAVSVEHEHAHSELGALVLENRLIKALRPPGNVALKRTDRWVYLRCRLDIPFPILELGLEPAPGLAITVGPLRGRRAAAELVEQLNSLFGLRHCGRRLPRRPHPSAYGQMGRCLSPCLGDLDPNLYRRRLDAALGLFTGSGDGRAALLERVRRDMRAAADERSYERAAWLRRRHDRLEVLLGRVRGMLRATHVGSRLVLAPHPARPRWDALWVVGGRVADWAPLAAGDGEEERVVAELERRTVAVLARRAPAPAGGARAAHVPAGEVDEIRIVSGWLAAHPVPALEFGEPPSRTLLSTLVRRARAEAGARASAGAAVSAA
jgi:DNA polymerase III subunit epsilon